MQLFTVVTRSAMLNSMCSLIICHPTTKKRKALSCLRTTRISPMKPRSSHCILTFSKNTSYWIGSSELASFTIAICKYKSAHPDLMADS